MIFNIKYIFIFLFGFFAATGLAQVKISGKVYDHSSHRAMNGASISVYGISTGTTTNDTGYYVLSLPENKKYRLKFSFLGYRDTVISVDVSGRENIILNISLSSLTFETGTVFITATRSRLNPEDVPARVNIIGKNEIENGPVLNTDDILQTIPGINIDRDWGIFSKNASVTMRGLSGTPRTLILLDGIPLNKTDGGGINWNMINPDNIERIEVIKGPVSTMYGGNAMDGVINVITHRPEKSIEGNFKAFYGTYNTFGATANLGGQNFEHNKGFFYNIYGYYKKGDGYITAPDSTLTKYNIKTYLLEYSGSARAGYQFKNESYAEVEYMYYDDKRGEGTRIYEKDGTYDRYPTNSLRATLNYNIDKCKIEVNSFFNNEHYFKQTETMAVKKNNKYTLYDSDDDRVDKGLWCSINRNISDDQMITAGIDAKQGSVDGSDTYFTSSDILTNKGKMNFLAFFSEYEISLLKKKLRFTVGLRYDIAQFKDGSFTIDDPSTLTAFMINYPTVFSDKQWQAFSPKLAGKYFFSDKVNMYISYARGFNAPMLDDMCKNGNVTKGFKIANPGLKPETLDNYELGANIDFGGRLSLSPSIYHSIGNDFQYFVGNGDSVNTGGDNLKPILQRENITKVQVTGAEVSVSYGLIKSLMFVANYSYNYSTVLKYNSDINPSQNLAGKYLAGVSPNQYYLGLTWKNRYFNASCSYNFVDKQWNDDLNTLIVPSYNSLDLRLVKTISQCTTSITVHDLLNDRHLDSKGELSPGRFFMISLSYKL